MKNNNQKKQQAKILNTSTKEANRFLKALINLIWLPLIPFIVGMIFWTIGLYNADSLTISQSNSFGNFTLICRVVGEAILFRVAPMILAISIMYTFVPTEKGAAILTVIVSYVVFIGVLSGMTGLWKITPYNSLPEFNVGGSNQGIEIYENISSTMNFVLGKFAPALGWIGGILIGVISVYIFNATSRYKAPKILGFFSGTRFVPVVTILVTALLALICFFSWYMIQVNFLANYQENL